MPDGSGLFVGDFVIWNFPNAGNPQKVQRYPIEWAAALRDMAAHGPELLLPAHGLPIEGRERIARVLDDIAGALERLVARWST
jgi:glyoxylase-like metal-dependent hydrolase (beta-lactamase superfamily II)